MDISVEETQPVENQPDFISTILQAVRGVANRMIGFFTLSDEEQSQAGIDLTGEGRGK
jgi:hypothetical protein